MNKKNLILVLTFTVSLLFLSSTYCIAQTDDNPYDDPIAEPGGTIPIPGIVYFLAAMVGIGVKKLYHDRKKN